MSHRGSIVSIQHETSGNAMARLMLMSTTMMLVLLARLVDDCALAVAASVTQRCDAIVRESYVLTGMKKVMDAFGNRGGATGVLPAYAVRS